MTREEAIKILKAIMEALSAPQTDLISRELAMERIANDNVVGGMERINEYNNSTEFNEYLDGISDAITTIFCDVPSAVAETNGDMGEVSDGYHTFNQLYHQRAVLFATIVKQNKEKAWKSWKHEDGKFCFDSNKEWFIVGVDTPEGSYTYHYEKKYWDLFDCVELEHGKFWDGHTEEDVTRLLSLPSAEYEWIESRYVCTCSHCGYLVELKTPFCPNCGVKMKGEFK